MYMGQNEWIHVNCALWSAEVYEEADGVVQKAFSAVARGRKLVSALSFVLRRFISVELFSSASLVNGVYQLLNAQCWCPIVLALQR